MNLLYDGQVPVAYGQFYVVLGEGVFDLPEVFQGQVNGLCGAASAEEGLFLNTGLHGGKVHLRIKAWETAPPLDPCWEEAVEVPFTVEDNYPVLVEWYGPLAYELPLMPGTYRARYCAQGMDRAHQGEEVDRYSLASWPADLAPDMILRQTSQAAAYWHDYAKSLPQR